MLDILNKHQKTNQEKHPDTDEIKPWMNRVSDVIINDGGGGEKSESRLESEPSTKCNLSISQPRFAINNIFADQYL